MSHVIADPEILTAAATDLASIGSNVRAAHAMAAARTVSVVPVAADEVSASIAHLFSGYGQQYQALAGQVAAFHEQFVRHLTASAGAYTSAEAANTALLRPLTASAASTGRANGALPDQLLRLFNAAVGQLSNEFGAFISGHPAFAALYEIVAGLLFWSIFISFILFFDLIYFPLFYLLPTVRF